VAQWLNEQYRWIRLLAWVGLLFSLPLQAEEAPSVASLPTLANLKVTSGAAPGYVDDHLCGTCHLSQWKSYQGVAMSHAFYRPSRERVIEDFAHAHYYHAPSQRHYEMRLEGDDYIFIRYQLDAAGQPINRFEHKVDWIMGSGRHVRTYLYQTESGELYQLPIAWYTQSGQWGMQPGFDRPDHNGVLRRIRRECLFCHNAYPEVPADSDNYLDEHRFPHQLPEGTGCQRCHGPGEQHLKLLLGGATDLEAIRSAIVNPRRLSRERRDDICYECHMLPAVATPPVRRFDRADFSFRPGQRLSDYALAFDIEERDHKTVDRFEINHHPFRLSQSRCVTESEPGALGCLDCHDPHVKVPVAERPAHYRKVCNSCHQGLDHPAVEGQALDDCVSCHMPTRRTHDVVQVLMTDHRIQKPLPEQERIGPRQEQDPHISNLHYLYPDQAPAGDLGEIYRMLAILRPSGGLPKSAIDYLEKLLKRTPVDSPIPYFDLVTFQLKDQRFSAALTTLDTIIERFGQSDLAKEWRAVALFGQGEEHATARALLEQLAAGGSERAEVWFNLGVMRYADDEYTAAEESLRHALQLRPTLVRAWYFLGQVQQTQGAQQAAVTSYRTALELDPSDTRAYLGIINALEQVNAPEEAERYRRHGLQVADNPKLLAPPTPPSP